MPYHLLGVETATSIFSAAVLGLPTGGLDTRPVTEVGIRDRRPARRSAPRHGPRPRHPRRDAGLHPPAPIAPDAPVPFYMAAGATLAVDAEAGTLLTYRMIEEPAGSVLWAMKREQDRLFLA